jgi:uncharacterized membrane protein YsdA (DUF1294 family)/cold shock CspA family protein
MRIAGKITHWNADKGYGFITPETGAKQVFVHIKAFSGRLERPEINQLVSFVLSADKQGRPCAERVALAGEKSPDRFKRNDRNLYIWTAVTFLILLAAITFGSILPLSVLVVYGVMSTLTFAVYWQDKSAAESNGSRTPEKTLHSLALLGGWPGAMIAQQVLRHKSSKEDFRAVFWVTVVFNCLALAWMFTQSGRQFLEALVG